jgi:hypothetical protein
MKKILKNYLKVCCLASAIILVPACEQPVDPVIESVLETNETLQKHIWTLEDFRVELKDDDIPPPILFSLTEAEIAGGVYDLDDMVLDASDARKLRLQFTPEKEIVHVDEEFDFVFGDASTYFVFNDRSIRLSGPNNSLNYRYNYFGSSREMMFSLTEEQATKTIEDINKKLIKHIANQTPDKIGDLVADILFNNEKVQQLINDQLVGLISGKIEFINDLDPDAIADSVSARIIMALQSVDWEGELTQLLKTELEKITNIDAEAVSQQIGAAVAQKINDELTVDKIYNIVLPFIENITENPESSAGSIAQLIVNLFGSIFDENKIKDIIRPAWVEFTMLDSTKVSAVSDTLAGVIQNVWLNEANISSIVLPFAERIDSTSILQMGALAQEVTDSIQTLIDKINAKLPDLNLNPDYQSMKSQIQTIFIAAKPLIGLAGGPQQAADDVAAILVSQILNKSNISSAVAAGINFLQGIDSETATNTLTTWLINLATEISPSLINYLQDLLAPIIENLNPDYTAFKIAQALNGFIQNNVTESAIANLVLPILNGITNINAEAVANYLAVQLLDSELIKENINQENIKNIMLPILQNLKDTDVEELVNSLIQELVNSDLFKTVLTEETISTVISLIIYNSAWEKVKVANNFKEVTIILTHE